MREIPDYSSYRTPFQKVFMNQYAHPQALVALQKTLGEYIERTRSDWHVVSLDLDGLYRPFDKVGKFLLERESYELLPKSREKLTTAILIYFELYDYVPGWTMIHKEVTRNYARYHFERVSDKITTTNSTLGDLL